MSMKVYGLNERSFLVVRGADIRNRYRSLAYDPVGGEVLSIDLSAYLVLACLVSHPNSSAGEISRAIDNSAFKMGKESLEDFLDKLVVKNVIYEQVR